MAVVYLKHPQHGTKVACGDAEVAYDEAQGWVRYDLTDASPPAEEAPPPRRTRKPRRASE